MITSVRAYLRTDISRFHSVLHQLKRLLPGVYLAVGHRFVHLEEEGTYSGAGLKAKCVHYIVSTHQLWKNCRGLAFETFTEDVLDEPAMSQPLVSLDIGTTGGQVIRQIQEKRVHRGISNIAEVTIDGFAGGHLAWLGHLAGP